MELEKIKVIKNFLSVEDAEKIIKYINNNIKDSVELGGDGSSPNFVETPGRWYKRRMGLDDEMPGYRPERSITRLEDIEDLTKRIIEKAKIDISEAFKDTDKTYIASLWLAKHLKEDWLSLHSDVGRGYNPHFFYSSVLYLNTVDTGGELYFPTMDLYLKPNAGDLVVFLSHGEDLWHEVKATGQERYTIPMWFTKDSSKEVLFK
jgi:Rps23 Pro-64 3,4-dihydroxylase Tpa1-like proline 4-hydroxylase